MKNRKLQIHHIIKWDWGLQDIKALKNKNAAQDSKTLKISLAEIITIPLINNLQTEVELVQQDKVIWRQITVTSHLQATPIPEV